MTLIILNAGKGQESNNGEKDMHDFQWALTELKAGREVSRAGWNGKGMSLRTHWPEPGGRTTLPYIAMKTVTGDIVPWLASQSDLLGEDWEPASSNAPKPSP